MSTTTRDIEDIKWLRDETGAGVMDAKKALQEAAGDRAKAKKILEQKGVASAAKRADRTTSNGIVEAYIHSGGQIGALVELDSETDFVSRMPQFKELAHEIAMQVAATNPQFLSVDQIPAGEVQEMKTKLRAEAVAEGKPENVAEKIAEGRFDKYAKGIVLLEQPYIREESKTIKQLIQELSAQTKENIVLRRFQRFQVGA